MKVSPWLRYHARVYDTLSDALKAVEDGPVYLCGGINGLSDADCKDWRATATEILQGEGMTVIDPMRRDYRGVEDQHISEIVDGDKEDILGCMTVLVNASKPSWGTAMEIMYAHHAGCTVLAFLSVKETS